MDTRSSQPSRGIVLVWYALSVSLGALGVLGGMLSSSGSGLSLSRLGVALGLLVIFLAFATLTIRAYRNPEWAQRMLETWFIADRFGQLTGWLGWSALVIGWIGCFLPDYRLGALETYLVRLRPALALLLLVGVATLLARSFVRGKLDLRDAGNFRTLKVSLAWFVLCLLGLAAMFASGLGISLPDDFWYGAGTPILVWQLIIAVAGGLLFAYARRGQDSKRFDLLVFFSIFVVTAVLWALEPLQKSFMFIGPYPPDNVLYPFADAAAFDLGSQFTLIGRNIFTVSAGYFFERPLYISFLAYLHSLFGENYHILMAAQAAIFAILPALIYWIGRSLNLRAIGFSAALVASLRGINAIAASSTIDAANPKVMLTDFPTAIGVALVVLLACEWLKKPAPSWRFSLWTGAAIAMVIMLRTNGLVLLAFIPLLGFVRMLPQWKRWLFQSALILVAVVALTFPWEVRNASLGGVMYNSIYQKIWNVIIQRYVLPQSGFLPSETELASVEPILPAAPAADLRIDDCNSVVCFAPNHFLHNIVTSILVLPVSPTLHDLRHAVKADPYWRMDWDGVFPASALLLFGVNIFFIVLGVVIAWKRNRLAGLIPLAIFLFYNVSNAFARTSGGRYVAPMDWISPFYFLIGVLWTFTAFSTRPLLDWNPASDSAEAATPEPWSWPRAGLIVAILLGLGALLPLSEHLHPDRFQNFDASAALVEREQTFANSGLPLTSVEAFLQNKNAEAIVGRVLYPRVYNMNQGEPAFQPYVVRGFPRLAFTLVGPGGIYRVVLPGGIPERLHHASDVLVLGCKGRDYFDAIAVVLLDEKGALYTRLPASELTCPLQQPVCDANLNCH